MTVVSEHTAAQSAMRRGVLGGFIGDAIAMPVHWYYDRDALRRDYGNINGYQAPRNPHPDSILWRSQYHPLNAQGDILRDQAVYWGRRGVHYHQFLAPGENTLNLRVAALLGDSLLASGRYVAGDFLTRYRDFMLEPGRYRDTYVEEWHREFFTKYASGLPLHQCGGNDEHVGGMAALPVILAYFAEDLSVARAVVREHLSLSHKHADVLAAGDAFTKILHDVAYGADLREAVLLHATEWISGRKLERWCREPDEVVIGRRLSPACYLPDAFSASLYFACRYAGNFRAGVCANAQAGGDNCHRGVLVGALLAASDPSHVLPVDLLKGLHESARIEALAEGLAKGRTTPV